MEYINSIFKDLGKYGYVNSLLFLNGEHSVLYSQLRITYVVIKPVLPKSISMPSKFINLIFRIPRLPIALITQINFTNL